MAYFFVFRCKVLLVEMALKNRSVAGLFKVEKFKEQYGIGASSKLIIYNDSSDKLTLTNSDHFWGKWQNEAPAEIPPQTYASFLHVKTDGTMTGSIGSVVYKNSKNEKVFFGWYCPYTGK